MKDCNVYEQPVKAGQTVEVDDTTFANLCRKKYLAPLDEKPESGQPRK